MKKIFTTIVFIASCILSISQNVNLEVRITRLERNAYSDCAACGNPTNLNHRGIHQKLQGLSRLPIAGIWGK